MLKVEMTKKSANPFYGLRSCLELYQSASKGSIPGGLLDKCWAEVQNDKEKREMFFSLLFSFGDITARQHNLFRKKKVDSGGNSQREVFYDIIQWLKGKNYPQFKKFLFASLFNEYTCFDTLLRNRVQTQKKKAKVLKIFNALIGTEEYLNDLATFVAGVIQGKNPADKYFIAKFLSRPRMSKRKNHKRMLNETREVMKAREKFLIRVCDKAGFDYFNKGSHYEFPGYIEWRKKYNDTMESVLFSSRRITEFDEVQFKEWLNKLPSGARYRVRRRILDANDKLRSKWPNLGKWFLEWEKFKETKQTEVRVLEEKIRQGMGTQDDEVKLKEVKKEAKVTVGATNFDQMFTEIVAGTIDKVKVQPFLDKVNLPYNTLVFVDDSGSMRGSRHNGITAFDFATFMATICLMKNPDDVGRSLLGFYSSRATLYSTMVSRASTPNTILRAKAVPINEPLIKPEEHFLDNLKRIREFAHSVMTSNGTNISAIPRFLHQQLSGDPTMLEQLQNFPVWTIISDGNWNSGPSAEASINMFMKECENFFGFRPFIIAIDVASTSSANVSRFQGIDNFMFIPPNPAQIEQLLTNFKDMDVMDVYFPLEALFRSNRYTPVRDATV